MSGLSLHVYFQNKLRELYNDFLINKYQTTENLLVAWGELLPGEDLNLKNVDAGARGTQNQTYNEKRVKDFTAFVLEIVNKWNALKKEYEERIKHIPVVDPNLEKRLKELQTGTPKSKRYHVFSIISIVIGCLMFVAGIIGIILIAM